MKNISRERSLAQEMEFLLEEVCVGVGVCSISAKEYERIVSRDSYIADECVEDILKVEGLQAEWHKHVARAVREKFVKRFGEELHAQDISG